MNLYHLLGTTYLFRSEEEAAEFNSLSFGPDRAVTTEKACVIFTQETRSAVSQRDVWWLATAFHTKKEPTKKDCAGCRDDFYNHNRMGLNETESGPQCWSLAEATFERAKDVPIDMPPPYTHIPLTKRPNCYRAKGYARVKEAGR